MFFFSVVALLAQKHAQQLPGHVLDGVKCFLWQMEEVLVLAEQHTGQALLGEDIVFSWAIPLGHAYMETLI